MTKNTPRIFISLLLMLLCIGILPVSAFASSGDYPDDTLPAVESSAADTQETKQIGTVTTNGGNLNVRTGAGLDNTAFTQLPNGTVVDVIGRDGDWVKILLPARVGYVYGSYLTVTDAADSTVSIGGITLPLDEKELTDLWQRRHTGKRRNLCWSSSKANRPKNVHTKQRSKRARKRSFDMNITFEEQQLMSLYNTGTRTGLIAALEEMRGYLAADETELRELTDSAIAKLRRMSDAEYDALDLFPDFEKEDMDAE